MRSLQRRIPALLLILAASSEAGVRVGAPAAGASPGSPASPAGQEAPSQPALLAAAAELAVRAAAAGVPPEDAAESAADLVEVRLAAAHFQPVLAAALAQEVRLAVLAASPAGVPIELGPLNLGRARARKILGSRAGRDREAVLARLRTMLPSQTDSSTDEELLALVPALVSAAERVPLPLDVQAPLERALGLEAPR